MQARRSAWAFLEDGYHEVSSPRACRRSAGHQPFARSLLRRTAGRSGACKPTGEHHARPKHAVTFTDSDAAHSTHHSPASHGSTRLSSTSRSPAGGSAPSAGPTRCPASGRSATGTGAASRSPAAGTGTTAHGSAAPAAP
ncbi:hypothetical protein [Arthrobacter ramosus]|uniref:hypothetical protein n=1 Tax=Arthrobacter ramosus TaxID=1672 RepID=UPI001F371B7B|nr:hypothetical protein [Arthrobacter ramosus]